MREGQLDAFVFKGDCLTDDNRDKVALNVPIEMLLNTTYYLIFTHPEGMVTIKGFLNY